MTSVKRWLLPDGVEDILPSRAHKLESLRRELLDLFESWGYELVIPPLIEFLDSLLVGASEDLDLHTFKVTDQVSGKMMGIRADVTLQAARIDAHSLNRRLRGRHAHARAGGTLARSSAAARVRRPLSTKYARHLR